MHANHVLRMALAILTLSAGIKATAQEEVVFRDGFESRPFRINEIESSDPNMGFDWVEFRNEGPTAIDLTGWYFTDGDPINVYPFPTDTTVEPGGFLAFDLDVFGLGSDDSVLLYSPQDELIDSYAWVEDASTTYARCPDSTGAFVPARTPTRGAANDCYGNAVGPFVINEIESFDDQFGADWVEFHNRGEQEVDLTDWYFTDSDPTNVYFFPMGTIVPAGGYLVIEDTTSDVGLGSADSVLLYGPGGLAVDSFDWTTHATTTYGRCPDGTGTYVATAQPTKGAVNLCP